MVLHPPFLYWVCVGPSLQPTVPCIAPDPVRLHDGTKSWRQSWPRCQAVRSEK